MVDNSCFKIGDYRKTILLNYEILLNISFENFLFRILLIYFFFIEKSCTYDFPLITNLRYFYSGEILYLPYVDCTYGKAIVGFHLKVNTQTGTWAYEYACYSSGN